MSCSRCRGLLIAAEFREHDKRMRCRRCVNCGNYVDPWIEQNRALVVLPEVRSVRAPIYDLARMRKRIEQDIAREMEKL